LKSVYEKINMFYKASSFNQPLDPWCNLISDDYADEIFCAENKINKLKLN